MSSDVKILAQVKAGGEAGESQGRLNHLEASPSSGVLNFRCGTNGSRAGDLSGAQQNY